jgi:hypothetical protein
VWRTPLGKILAAALLLRLVGLSWGLPGSDGWDDDGVAPRDFLVGLATTYWPHHHYIYPPLQLLVLAVVSMPVWVFTALSAPSLRPDALIATFIQVGPMTALAVIARLTTIALSLGLLWNVAKIGQDLRGSARAGAWTAAACAANAALTYYSQTTNLDVPYLFWAVLALRALIGAVIRRHPRLLRRVPIFASLAIATKDQAYALFLLAVPFALAMWIAMDQKARASARDIVREAMIGSAIGGALLLVVDGALINPGGFGERLRILLGTASQDHAFYANDWSGRGRALVDTMLAFRDFYPWAFAPFAVLGLLLALRELDGAKRVAGLVPLLVALSFTVCFNLIARRTEHRFVLPQALMWAIYAGLAFDALQDRLGRMRSWAPWVVTTPCFAAALFQCAAVDAAMVLDPRYDAERWMKARFGAGDHVEVYGNNVHLPRLPSWVAVERVDTTPLDGRNPLPGVVEVSARFSDIEWRRPRFVVVSEFWAHRYLLDPAQPARAGHVLTAQEAKFQEDLDSKMFFRDLCAERLKYRWAHLSTWQSRIWPRVNIHASLTREIWIFERTE